tara:strand:+ start:43424 stop:44284 length:861 start_codon:yes stop_codon:yes gene_type:complete
MEKLHNRRNFLKSVGVIAGITQLPLIGWSSGFSTLLNAGVNPANEFSLLKLEKILSGYKYPFADQFSTISFEANYKLYNLYGDNAVFSGEFALISGIKGKNRQFEFSNWRLANNGIKKRNPEFKYIVSGGVQCQNDSTLSPEKWTVSSRIALGEDGPAYAGTGFRNEGKAKNGIVSLITSGTTIKKNYGNMPLSWKWGLPAVVQNMAKESLPELQFAMLDEFDAIYQNQIIRFSRKVTLDCGSNRLVDFKVYELTGDGVIPTVYWVDNMNRTVFVVSGMEAFVLEA